MTERESVNILKIKEIATSPWIQLKRVVYETEGGEAMSWSETRLDRIYELPSRSILAHCMRRGNRKDA